MGTVDKGMETVDVVEKLGDAEFKWGKRKGVGVKKGVQFYESFTYDGVDYALFDCVYMHNEGDEPYIGKLVRIWENAEKSKKVRVQWFFRPSEISYWLRHQNETASANEVFLASGEGPGLDNVNPLEVIAGKCNVLCLSKDTRNPQPSEEQVQMADYVFHRTFDVGNCVLSESMGDKVGNLEVNYVFNRREKETDSGPCLDSKQKTKPMESTKDIAGLDNRPSKRLKLDGSSDNSDSKNVTNGKKLKTVEMKKEIKHESSHKVEPNSTLVKGTHELDGPSKKKLTGHSSKLDNLSPKEEVHEEKKVKTFLSSSRLGETPKSVLGPSNEKPIEKKKIGHSFGADKGEEMPEKKKSALSNNLVARDSLTSIDVVIEGKTMEVNRRLEVDADKSSKWFRLPPWEERILTASDRRMLVLLQNLDPEYTSAEIEEVIDEAFKEKCSAKMVQRTALSSPHDGQALVIFNTRKGAERVVQELKDGCLLLSNQRPLVGSIAILPKNVGKQSGFVGHLFIDKIKLQLQKETKDAISTSHCAQPNTIEHELAMEWCLLQSRSDLWWKDLYRQQGKELKRLMGDLKSE